MYTSPSRCSEKNGLHQKINLVRLNILNLILYIYFAYYLTKGPEKSYSYETCLSLLNPSYPYHISMASFLRGTSYDTLQITI